MRRRAGANGMAVPGTDRRSGRRGTAAIHGVRSLRVSGRAQPHGRPPRPVALPAPGGQADVSLGRGQAAQPGFDVVATHRTRRALLHPASACHGELVRPPPPGLVPPTVGRDHVRGRAGRALVPVLAPPATALCLAPAGTPAPDRGDRQLRLLQPSDRRALPVLARPAALRGSSASGPPASGEHRPAPPPSPASPAHASAGSPPRRSCCSACRSPPANSAAPCRADRTRRRRRSGWRISSTGSWSIRRRPSCAPSRRSARSTDTASSAR